MNASIKEGGIARLFDKVKKVLTKLQGGGNQTWVPEAGTNLTTKSINKNGVYRAVDDGDYGWSTVYVNVPTTSSVTGIDPDTGKTVTYNTDPSTGDLVKREVPTSIAVITPPTNPYGIYTEGQTITKDGIVVKAYYADGREWGVVPVSELTLEPTIAVYDASTDYEYLAGDGINVIGLSGIMQYRYPDNSAYVYRGTWGALSMPGSIEENPETEFPHIKTTSNNAMYRLYLTQYDGTVYAAESTGFFGDWNIQPVRGQSSAIPASVNVLGAVLTNSDIASINSRDVALGIAYESTNDPDGIDITELERISAGSHQTITVLWPRIGDGMVLEATFEILVAPSPSGGDDT